MSQGFDFSGILELPNEIEPFLSMVLVSDEHDFLKRIKTANITTQTFSDELTKKLIQKGVIKKINGNYEIITGIESLWTLLQYATHKNIYIPTTLFRTITEYLQNFYLQLVKKHPEKFYIFTPKRAFLPKYKSHSFTNHLFETIDNASIIVQRSCRCRETFNNCVRPLDTCLVLNDLMEDDIEEERAKRITREKALTNIETSWKNGNVLILYAETLNDPKSRMELHSCCSCCSVFLNAILDPNIGQKIQIPQIVAEVDNAKCMGCGTCKEVCMFGARRLIAGVCNVDTSLCVGCALCVPWCTERAVRMVTREKEKVSKKNVIC